MRRISTFLAGALTGGVLVYAVLHQHVIRSAEGFHFVPKVHPQFSSTYADIRQFQVNDWAAHAEIAAALVQANRRDLMDNALQNTLQQGLDQFLPTPPQ